MASRDMEIRAAEYVFGLLSASEAEKAGRLRRSDSEFAAAVEAWEARLSPLAEAGPAVRPPEQLRGRIEAALDARATGESLHPGAMAKRIERLQQSLSAWRMAAVGAAAAAAVIALAWFGGLDMPLRQPVAPEKYVAMLQNDAGETGFVVTFDMKDKTCAIRKMLPELPPAEAYELWALIKNGGAPPLSLGLVGDDAYATAPMPVDLDPAELEKGVKLAISVEPQGGAPEKTAMGPVIFAGKLIKLSP